MYCTAYKYYYYDLFTATVQPTFLDPILEQAITHIKLLLEKESMERICNGNGGTSVDSKALMEQLKSR